MHVLREAGLLIVLLVAAGVVVDGIADLSAPAAKIAAGIFLAAIGALFLVEAD